MDKESWRRGGDSRPDPRGETSFDEVAKGLANGTISRRQALRWMGGALAGAAFASVPGVAFAAPEGNLACDEFCHANFSEREAGQCTRAGSHGTGPCYECTPGIGPGPHFTPECGPNEEFNPETCECEVIGCSGGSCEGGFPNCNNDPGCFCLQTAEGGSFCFLEGSAFCGQTCQSSLDCGPGSVCVVNTCCPFDPLSSTCLPISQTQCPSGASSLADTRQVQGSGPRPERSQ